MGIMPFDFTEISKVKRGKFLKGEFVHNPLQSMCYDSRNRKYIVGFAEPGGALSALVRMKDLSFAEDKIDLVVTHLPLEHCNDLAYCLEEHKIYAVGGGWWVAVVNPDTLQVERKIPVNMTAWSLARYPDGCWFIHDGGRGDRCSHDFSQSITVSTNDRQILIDSLHAYAGCWQGAIFMDGKPYMIYNEFSAETGKPISFVLMSCENGDQRTIYRAETDCEVESADIVDGKMMLAYNQPYNYGGSVWDMSEIYTKTVYAETGPIDILANKEVSIDCSKYVPDGYQLASANINIVLKNGSIRTLPYNSGNGCILYIWKIAKNKIYLKSINKAFEQFKVQITGFCRKR